MFHTLRYTQILEQAGVSRPQAETHVEVMEEIIGNHLATKSDLETGLLKLEHRLTLRMGVLFAAQTTLFTVLMTVLKFL